MSQLVNFVWKMVFYSWSNIWTQKTDKELSLWVRSSRQMEPINYHQNRCFVQRHPCLQSFYHLQQKNPKIIVINIPKTDVKSRKLINPTNPPRLPNSPQRNKPPPSQTQLQTGPPQHKQPNKRWWRKNLQTVDATLPRSSGYFDVFV